MASTSGLLPAASSAACAPLEPPLQRQQPSASSRASGARAAVAPCAVAMAPMMHLKDAQAEEEELLPVSPSGACRSVVPSGAAAAPPQLTLGVVQQLEGELVPPSSAGSTSVRGAVPPPTPPRRGFQARKPANAIGLTMPDDQGRWAPIKYSSSMQNSPVGSLGHPSLAPSESVYGGGGAMPITPRSARSIGARSRGCFSVREDDEDSEQE